ncbi:MAG: hypothetical protein Q7S52_01890 [bacterium]|nr:hypothetical protein [bacterium]
MEQEGEVLNISDGMDPISIPERITKENFAALFGSTLPEGLSPEIFDGGELHLEQ